MATKVTSASPIIRADAVEAVRAGFRVALSRARMPGAPPIDFAGAPRMAASGRTTFAAFIETPKKSSSTPPPSISSRGPVAIPLPSAPMQTSAIAAARIISAVAVPYFAKRDGGSTEPSRAAATGGGRGPPAGGGVGWAARPPPRRPHARDHGHDRADEQRDDDRAGREDGGA